MLFIYVGVSLYFSTWFSLFFIFIGLIGLAPLTYFLNSRGLEREAKFLFIISCSFYISTSSLGLGLNGSGEYFYIPAAIIPLLIFQGRDKAYIIPTLLMPLLFWVFTEEVGIRFIPVEWIADDAPYSLIKKINFIGAFSITLIFIASFLKSNKELNDLLLKKSLEQKELSNKIEDTERDIGELIKNSRNEIYIFDLKKYKFIEVNPAARENLGFSISELQGKHPWDIKPDFPKIRFLEVVAPLLMGEITILDFETSHKRKDGSVYPVEIHLQLSTFSGERVFQAMVIDRTEHKKMQHDLLHASRLSSIGELAAGVGHEINNPLAVAMGILSRMKKEIVKEEIKVSKLLERMVKQEDALIRIQRIVSGLKTYARSSIGDESIFSASDAIKSTLDLVEELYRHDGVKITLDLESEGDQIKGSIGKYQQVLTNLMGNAKDAMKDSENKMVGIRLRRTLDHLELRVSDKGPGIPRDLQGKVFESFFTTKEIGKGTGLGLSICSKLCQELGGRISIEESGPTGTTFLVEVPVFVNNGVTEESNIQRPKIEESKRLKVLVTDDEEDLREIIVDLLTEMGHEVQEASNGVEALKILENEKFDVILSDMKMPEMGGVEFFEEVSRSMGDRRPFFIAVTGGISETGEYSKVRSLVDFSLLKPFDEDDLLEALRELKAS